MIRDERGQASALLVGVLLLGLMVAGLGVDGARMFTARRDLQNVADSAALAGASSLDEAAYRATGGADVRLDPSTARQAVSAVVRASGLPSTTRVDVRVESDRVVVQLVRPVRPLFLGLAGIGPQRIGAHASAAPRTG
ncbi:MAG: pilus assembly protein TadG-related protein [Acidimicrobiia bacterium]